ncbi:MAG: hypothetical protein HDS22_00165 [Bacteroides sp.]|nr:hypothetical protein [Bacteroides sp.]
MDHHTVLPRLSEEFFNFIDSNRTADPKALRLKWHGRKSEFDTGFAITQIECRQRTARKLGDLIKTREFLFPDTLAAEQASHQGVARFHRSLMNGGRLSLLDMTAGLGVDALTMSEGTTETVAIELDPLKEQVLAHNIKVMGKEDMTSVNADSVEWLRTNEHHFNVIFIDPARRKADNSRAYNFHDCLPDVISAQDLLLKHCDTLLIKASPLLDITQTLIDINHVAAIRVVCVGGECKEVLVEAHKSKDDNEDPSEADSKAGILFEAIDLDEHGNICNRFSFYDNPVRNSSPENSVAECTYASEDEILPGTYLYEPNAAVMKLQPWRQLANQYPGLLKLAPSSHLFISSTLYTDFPGRILTVRKLIENKNDRKSLKGLPANVSVRNYPVGADELRKKLGVKEGKNLFVYGTTLSRPLLLLAERSESETGR